MVNRGQAGGRRVRKRGHKNRTPRNDGVSADASRRMRRSKGNKETVRAQAGVSFHKVC